MAKFAGKIGFTETYESEPGVWTECITEHDYYGDILKQSRRWETASNTTNDTPTIQNTFSILADSFMYEHCYAMRYIKYLGQKWKVESVTIDRPRITITIGGLYNGSTT